jgi:hypothetical protein
VCVCVSSCLLLCPPPRSLYILLIIPLMMDVPGRESSEGRRRNMEKEEGRVLEKSPFLLRLGGGRLVTPPRACVRAQGQEGMSVCMCV